MRLSQPIWPRFLPTPTVLGFATLGPIGRRLPAPGTWGSLAGILYFVVIFQPFGPVADWRADALRNVLLSAFATYVAIGICGEAEFRLGRKDPSEVILDEFVSIPLCFLGWPLLRDPGRHPWAPWIICLAGFALFRFYDILKPLGIRRIQNLIAGWGVVLDDTAAAIAACATLHLAHWAWVLTR